MNTGNNKELKKHQLWNYQLKFNLDLLLKQYEPGKVTQFLCASASSSVTGDNTLMRIF